MTDAEKLAVAQDALDAIVGMVTNEDQNEWTPRISNLEDEIRDVALTALGQILP